jgi:hypothetical protein
MFPDRGKIPGLKVGHVGVNGIPFARVSAGVPKPWDARVAVAVVDAGKNVVWL